METSSKALIVAVSLVVLLAGGLSLMSYRPESAPAPSEATADQAPAPLTPTPPAEKPPSAEAPPAGGAPAEAPPAPAAAPITGDVLMTTRTEAFRPLVQASSTQVRVTNQNSTDYTNCLFVVNPMAVGPDFRVSVANLPAHQGVDIGYLNFVDPSGNRFNPFRMKLNAFSSICEFQGKTETMTGKM